MVALTHQISRIMKIFHCKCNQVIRLKKKQYAYPTKDLRDFNRIFGPRQNLRKIFELYANLPVTFGILAIGLRSSSSNIRNS